MSENEKARDKSLHNKRRVEASSVVTGERGPLTAEEGAVAGRNVGCDRRAGEEGRAGEGRRHLPDEK